MRFATLGTALLLLLANSAFAAERPNVLLICVDDLRPELDCYGVDYIHSPNIDDLAARGRLFEHHYVQAPTCGASRFTLLTGTYGPYGNGALFARAKRGAKELDPSLPAWFRQHGYRTVSVGKVSHHPGGRGGADWDSTPLEMPHSWDRNVMPVGPWQHPRGAMHGLANGEIRKRAGEMDVLQSEAGPDTIYPDGLTTDESLLQLDRLAEDDKPFFLAVGIIRPHLPFGAPAKYMERYENAHLPPIPHPRKPSGKTTWHGSGEFMKYNRWGKNPNRNPQFATTVRKHYAACVTYADALIGRLIERLEALELREETIIVLWGDHGWHLGEHAVWGKHTLFEESLHSPLIIVAPGMNKPGETATGIVETIDIYPTLCELADLPVPEFLDGVSLRPMLEDPSTAGHAAISYTGNARTIRAPNFRLIAHKDGHRELYDFRTETREDVADEHPQIVEELRKQMETTLKNADR